MPDDAVRPDWKAVLEVLKAVVPTLGLILAVLGSIFMSITTPTEASGIGARPSGTVIFILFIVFLLGFVLDWIEITLIVLPLMHPIFNGLGLDVDGYGVIDEPARIWLVILVAVTLQTSFLTPPAGFALFYLRGVCPP